MIAFFAWLGLAGVSGIAWGISHKELKNARHKQEQATLENQSTCTQLTQTNSVNQSTQEIAQQQKKNIAHMTWCDTVRIVSAGLCLATGLTGALHIVFTGFKKCVTIESVFNEADIISFGLGIFTAVTALMIYKKQTESAELAAQEQQTRDDIYKNTLQQFYGTCLEMEIHTKNNEALQKTSNTWQMDSIQRLCLEKNADNTEYKLHLTLSNAIRSQNILNIDSATCTKQNIAGINRFKIILYCKTVAEETADNINYELVVPLKKSMENATGVNPDLLFNALRTSSSKQEAIEIQLYFKNLQHKYLKIPQVQQAQQAQQIQQATGNENKKLTALIENIKNDVLQYDADMCIKLSSGVLGTNVVQFDDCQIWRVYTATTEGNTIVDADSNIIADANSNANV